MTMNRIFDSRYLRTLIDEINSTIDVSLSLALDDFNEVTSLIRTKNDATASCRLNDFDVSAVISRLQYYDVFKQKTEHIKLIHGWVLKELESESFSHNLSISPKVNLLRLNQLQYQITNTEYMNSVEEIEKLLQVYNEGPQQRKTFVYTKLILSGSRIIDTKFTSLCALTAMYDSFNIDRMLGSINSLYSIASERTILEAYREKPDISLHELQVRAFQNSNESNIDLFQ